MNDINTNLPPIFNPNQKQDKCDFYKIYPTDWKKTCKYANKLVNDLSEYLNYTTYAYKTYYGSEKNKNELYYIRNRAYLMYCDAVNISRHLNCKVTPYVPQYSHQYNYQKALRYARNSAISAKGNATLIMYLTNEKTVALLELIAKLDYDIDNIRNFLKK